MKFDKLNRLVGLLIFLITLVVYIATMADTVSFWDCGEFIACSFRLAVPHPPGAPLYLLVGRVFSLLPVSADIAFRINLISAISSAFTILLLHLTIVHLVREWRGSLESSDDWWTAIFSGVIGSLTFAFTHSFWFNAAEAEVYGPSMLFTALIVWLAMVWAEKSDKPGNERYLLLISYIIGLAIAVHLLNILALPFVAMIFYYKRYTFSIPSFLIMAAITAVGMLAIYPGIVKYMPLIALDFGFAGLLGFFVVMILGTYWAYNNRRHIVSLIFMSVFLISIGYASYATIYIRSGLNPNIDENNPETIENFIKYINREQYGEHSSIDRSATWKNSDNGKKYKSVGEFFWKYQVDHMYNRYFLWNFVGMDSNEFSVNPKQLWALPLILGLLGMAWHFYRDWKHGFAVFALFFMTGFAIILYLNQPDPQPRERDYSYVGSFFAFAIWVGLGYAAVVDWIKEYFNKQDSGLSSLTRMAVFALLFVLIPLKVFTANYHSHNRSGDFVAWDYSYNLLMSVEPDALLFTNGDNDTFPLWYLQEVEGIRTDVRIVNLSLLNTDWYIKQLRDMEPKVPMHMPDQNIDRVGLMPWKGQKVRIDVPQGIAIKEQSEFVERFSFVNVNTPDKIEFKVDPAMNTPYGPMLRTQDWMILNIVEANRWKRPVYFAVTVPKSNMLSEMADYLRMDGLAMKLVPFKNWSISPTHLEKNLFKHYQYRNLNNEKVYYNENITTLLQNYRTAFIQLAEYYYNNGEMEKLKETLHFMDEKIDEKAIPWVSPLLLGVREAFLTRIDPARIGYILENYNDQRTLQYLTEYLMRFRDYPNAAQIAEKLYQINPRHVRNLSLLINVYEANGQPEKSIEPLNLWIQANPGDANARQFLGSIQARLRDGNTPSANSAPGIQSGSKQ